MLGRRKPAIPKDLTTEVEAALDRVAQRRSELDLILSQRASIPERRRAHVELGLAFQAADRVLRRAESIAKQPTSVGLQRSYLQWSQWRRRLSRVDLERQAHMFAEADDTGALFPNSVRTIDNGMSGPDIGDLQHGESRPPGTPARYGLDMRSVLAAVPQTALVAGTSRRALES